MNESKVIIAAKKLWSLGIPWANDTRGRAYCPVCGAYMETHEDEKLGCPWNDLRNALQGET